MKKKIINGLLMAALMLTATTSFVSCKDNVDDELVSVYDNLSKQKSALEKKISDLETDLNKKIADNATLIAENAKAIKEIQGEIDGLKKRLGEIDKSIETMQGDIKTLQDDLDALSKDVDAFKIEVNNRLDAIEAAFSESIQDFHTDWFVNSVFGANKSPLLNLKALAAFYGENLTYITDFPTTDASVIVGGEEGEGTKLDAADIAGAKNMAIPAIITQKERNAGKVYFYARANDQSKFDINNYTLKLKDANGREVPVNFTNLAQAGPNTLAWWGHYKIDLNWLNTAGETAEDAWFEADANIDTEDLVPNKFQIKEFINLDGLKKTFNEAWNDLKAKDETTTSDGEVVKTIVKAAAKILLNFYSGKMNGAALSSTNMSYTPLRMYLNRVTEDGDEVIMKTSELDIFATAVTPLSYNAFMEYEANAKVPTEKMKDVAKVVTRLGKRVGNEKMAEKVNNFLAKTANYIVRELNDHQLSRAIAPCIFYNGENGEINRLAAESVTTITEPGTMEIMMSSPTEELLAPAYAKYIAVLKDGKVLQQATVSGGVQYQELNFPTAGTYTVVFSAVDYHGFVVNKKYQIIVK